MGAPKIAATFKLRSQNQDLLAEICAGYRASVKGQNLTAVDLGENLRALKVVTLTIHLVSLVNILFYLQAQLMCDIRKWGFKLLYLPHFLAALTLKICDALLELSTNVQQLLVGLNRIQTY